MIRLTAYCGLFVLASLQVMVSAEVYAQEAPDGYTAFRAPINNAPTRYQGYSAQASSSAPHVPSGIQPYQASPEFPVKPSVPDAGGAASQGGDIHQGYVPSVEGDVAGQPSAATPTPEVEEVPLEPEKTKKAVLRFTDKIAARSTQMEVEVPSQASYQTLVVQVEKCQIAGDVQTPEHAMLMEVFVSEDNQGNPSNQRIFGGWMFKRKSSLTSLQHPYYDVTLVTCISDPSTKPKPVVKTPEAPKTEVKATDAAAPVTGDAVHQPINQEAKPASESAPSAATNPVNEPIYQDAGAADDKAAEDVANRAVDSVTKMLEEDASVSSGAELPENQSILTPEVRARHQAINQGVPSSAAPEADQGGDASQPSSD